MWYVIQVLSGKEEKAVALIRRALERVEDENADDAPEDLQDCHSEGEARRISARASKRTTHGKDEVFVPRYQVERKFHGQFKVVERNLFPGYVIAITRDIAGLNAKLAKVPTLTRILGSEKAFVPLDPTEQAFINSFAIDKHRIVKMSRAVDEGDRIVVMEGPLVGREGMIQKINRRKGTCRVTFEAFGRTLDVEVGLAVVTKNKSSAMQG